MTHNSTDILFQISQFVNRISVLVHFFKNFFATCMFTCIDTVFVSGLSSQVQNSHPSVTDHPHHQGNLTSV
jgi:hypothetical protein